MKRRAQPAEDNPNLGCNALKLCKLHNPKKNVKISNADPAVAVKLNRLRRFGRLHVFVFAVSPWRALPESFFLWPLSAEPRCCESPR